MPEIIDIVHEVLPDQLSVELLAMENECLECCSKLVRLVIKMFANVFGLGEVAEPEAKLEHKTLRLKTND